MAFLITHAQKTALFLFLSQAARDASNFHLDGTYKQHVLAQVSDMAGKKMTKIEIVYTTAATMYEDMEEMRARISLGEVTQLRGGDDVCGFVTCEGKGISGWWEVYRHLNPAIKRLVYLENHTLTYWNEFAALSEALDLLPRDPPNAHIYTPFGPRVSRLLPLIPPPAPTLKRKRGPWEGNIRHLSPSTQPAVAKASMLRYHTLRIAMVGPLVGSRDRLDGTSSTRKFNTPSDRNPEWPLARELGNLILDSRSSPNGRWQRPVVGCKFDAEGAPCKEKDNAYRHFRTQQLQDKKDGKLMDLGMGTLVASSEEVDTEFRSRPWWGGGALYDAGYVEGA